MWWGRNKEVSSWLLFISLRKVRRGQQLRKKEKRKKEIKHKIVLKMILQALLRAQWDQSVWFYSFMRVVIIIWRNDFSDDLRFCVISDQEKSKSQREHGKINELQLLIESLKKSNRRSEPENYKRLYRVWEDELGNYGNGLVLVNNQHECGSKLWAELGRRSVLKGSSVYVSPHECWQE